MLHNCNWGRKSCQHTNEFPLKWYTTSCTTINITNFNKSFSFFHFGAFSFLFRISYSPRTALIVLYYFRRSTNKSRERIISKSKFWKLLSPHRLCPYPLFFSFIFIYSFFILWLFFLFAFSVPWLRSHPLSVFHLLLAVSLKILYVTAGCRDYI